MSLTSRAIPKRPPRPSRCGSRRPLHASAALCGLRHLQSPVSSPDTCQTHAQEPGHRPARRTSRAEGPRAKAQGPGRARRVGDEASRLTVRRAGRRAEAGEGRAWGTAAPAELPAFPQPPVAQGPPQPGFSPCISSRSGFLGPQTPGHQHPSRAPQGMAGGRGTHALQPLAPGWDSVSWVCPPPPPALTEDALRPARPRQ